DSLSITERYQVNIEFQKAPLHFLYPQTPTGESISMVGSGMLRLGAENDNFSADTILESLKIRIRDGLLYLFRPSSIRFRDGELSINRFEIEDGQNTRIQLNGSRNAYGKLDYQLLGQVDLRYLPSFVKLVDRSSGTAIVKGSMYGYREDPITQFDIDVRDGYFSASWLDHPYEEVNGKLFVSPSRYEFTDWKGRRGGGEFEVVGKLTGSNFSIEGVDLKMFARQCQLKMVSSLPPILGDGDLHLVGSLEKMLLKGRVDIKEMLFSKRIDWEDAMLDIDSNLLEEAAREEHQNSWLAFHIDVYGDETVRIRNNLADLTATAKFQIIGDLNQIGTVGRLRAQPGGRILLKERDFEIQRAEIRFVDPFAYDPALDIALQTQVRSLEQDIDISYFIEGLYSDWKFRTYSNPKMPEADINALLFFGMTRDELERMGGLSSTLAVEGSDLIASKLGVVQRFNEVQEGVFQAEIFNFDRVDLISGTSNSGSFSSSLRILAEKDLGEKTRIRFEKDLTQTEDFYLSLEQKLANTFYLRSFWTSEQRGRYLDIGGAYGVEFQLRLEAD
ncbi:MAG: translocation/assembly module TamB domain-containing protein, partial [Myxococcota bacterium]|nr:translocation/assembly module TamB domain-containing protein [Myxococcota bacterium]